MILGDYIKWGPYTYIAGIVVLAIYTVFIYWKGYQHANSEYVKYKAEVSLASAQAEADIQRRLRLSDQVTADIKSDLATALAANRRRTVRVQSDCNTRGLSPVSSSSGLSVKAPVADSADTGIVLTADQCAEKLGDGIEDAVRFAWLIHWVQEQHMIGSKND